MKYPLKFSVMTVPYIQYSLDYTLESLKKCGFQYVEFWAGCPHFNSELFRRFGQSMKYIQKIKKKMDALNLKTVMYTPETLAYPLSYSHPDKNVRDKTVDYMIKACEEAAALDCFRVFINSGCALRDVPLEDSWKRCAESFYKICSFAYVSGIDIVLEQLQPYESNLVTSLKDCVRIKQMIPFDNLKICLDVVAMEVAGENMHQYFNTFPDDIVHIHLADQNHEVLGDGHYPIVDYLKYLENIKYDQFVSLEINDSKYWEDPHSCIYRSKEWLCKHQYMTE